MKLRKRQRDRLQCHIDNTFMEASKRQKTDFPIEHAFSKPPLLYKYPDANPRTVRNISIQLLKNERFYIKVCHIMNLLSLEPPFEEDYLSTQHFLSRLDSTFEDDLRQSSVGMEVSENQQISFAMNGPSLFNKFLSLVTVNDGALDIMCQVKQCIQSSAGLVVQLSSQIQELKRKLETIQKLNPASIKYSIEPNKTIASSTGMQFSFEVPSMDIGQQETSSLKHDLPLLKEFNQDNEEHKVHFSQKQYDKYEDVDQYLEGLKNQVSAANLTVSEQTIMNEKKEEVSASSSLYLKNIDKKGDTSDIINLILPYFKNSESLLKEQVEIVLMKKGKMRGQGFLNFKEVAKAIEIQEHLDGVMLRQKPLSITFSKHK